MWYTNSYRRHLCDMHIDDWDDLFLSKFSPEEYVENLKIAKVQNAMLYLQSHVGLCYYPTKTGVMHRAFIGREDAMKKTEELCHKNGMHVTGYYSLNYNTVEHDRHPAWRMIKSEGRSQREILGAKSSAGEAQAFASLQGGRYGFCCPNNLEYREFVYRQIDEMLELAHMEPLCAKNIFESVIMFILDDASLNDMLNIDSEDYDPDELCNYAREILSSLNLPEVEDFISELPEVDDDW